MKMLKTKSVYFIFSFLNLISLLFEYDGHDLFYLFLLVVLLIVLLDFCCSMQAFVHDSSFWYIQAFFLSISNYQL